MDKSCTGTITGLEFARFFHQLFHSQYAQFVDHAHISALFEVFDRHRNGSLSFEEFVLTFDMLLHGSLRNYIGKC